MSASGAEAAGTSEPFVAPSSFRRPEHRAEGPLKVTGGARYAADLRLPGMLHAATVWSPYPHARIVGIDTSAARALPGVRAVITGADVKPHRFGRRLLDWPILVWDRALFVGARVAAVAADTREIAEAAAALVEIDWEELPAVLTPEEALAEGAPVLHPEFASYVRLGPAREGPDRPNLRARLFHERGDPDRAFAQAARVFEHEFTIPRTHHGFIEPRAAVVWLEGDTIRVVSGNKAPFGLRDQMAASLGIPKERIVIDNAFIGGDFGGKGTSIDEYILYFLALATGRPVKHVMSYTEELRATGTRTDARIRLRTGVTADGRIVAHESHVVYNAGAYAGGMPVPHLLPGDAMLTLACYDLPNVRIEAYSAYTNTVPTGHFRAPGQPQNAFAAESHVDLIAHELGLDPLSFRLKNAARTGSVDVIGETWHSDKFVRVLETVARERPKAALPPDHGRGIGAGMRHLGGGKTSMILTLAPDLTIDVLTAVVDQGGGAHTMLQRVIAGELGIPPARVRIRRGSTAEAPHDPGVGGSRVTPVAGGAALKGARALRAKCAELAGFAAGSPDALARAAAGSFDALARAAVARGGPVQVVGEHQTESHDANVYAYDVEVAVDRETGQVTVVDVLLVVATGTILNPVAHRGQLEGGFVFGLGTTLMEELTIEDGRVTTLNLGEYKLPTIADIPPLQIVCLDDEPSSGPFGAGSVGELANPGIGPAVANAVANAVGARIHSLPITAEKVLKALR
ncbi:MAG: xanthine dehydrogenase family protein molybdopterin-binding subunit [Candidatus Limnocylindria bacterium]|nr:xanthine dehydrogenase family protein molybdopterin-binding subunit [Candidatus Limnocylindria bacterium]